MNNAINPAFDAFIGSLYADGYLPPVIVVEDIRGADIRYVRVGGNAVEQQDESQECPVFANWGTYYEFMGWAAHRSIVHPCRTWTFNAMVHDVLQRRVWNEETSEFITIIDGLINVQSRYVGKYGHSPVDLHKFIKSYLNRDSAHVLRRDIY